MKKCFFCKDVNIVFEENTIVNYRELNLCRECYNFFILGTAGKPPKFKTCKSCSETFVVEVKRSWAKNCFECWKKKKNSKTMKLSSREKREILIRVKKARREVELQDLPELQQKRKDFLDNLLVSNDVKTCEMHYRENFDPDKTELETPQFFHEYQFHNTRKKLPSETCAEIDKVNPDKAIKIICEICLCLLLNDIEFSVFYCKNGRSPHIKVYNVKEFAELNAYKRELLQKEFWKFICPDHFHLLDQGMWSEDKLYPLEYSVHWKHKTPFDLLFEYKLEEEKCKQ